LKDYAFEQTMKCRPEVIYKDFKACDGFNAMDSVKGLKVPALVICGSDDALTPPKYSYFLKEAIEGSMLIVIADAGHMVMMEKPDEVSRAIEDFTRRVEAAG
jgi:pimeloyl-ACP methyl ester carboxylesterase